MPDLIYSRRANNEPLSLGNVANLAPAAFTDYPIEGVSERYGHFTTLDAIELLKANGWQPVQAAQSTARTKERNNHTKHLIAFAREQDMTRPEGRPEIVLYNSSDRSSALKLYAGFFRWICSNSLVSGTGSEFKIYHSKNKISNFEDLLQQTIDGIYRQEEMIDQMRSRLIGYHHATNLIGRAASLRWKPLVRTILDTPVDETIPVGTYWNKNTIDGVLQPKRWGEKEINVEDRISLWEVFNRTQEGLMRRGAQVTSFTKNSPQGTSRRARAIASVAEAIRVNRDTWDIFEEALTV